MILEETIASSIVPFACLTEYIVCIIIKNEQQQQVDKKSFSCVLRRILFFYFVRSHSFLLLALFASAVPFGNVYTMIFTFFAFFFPGKLDFLVLSLLLRRRRRCKKKKNARCNTAATTTLVTL